MSDLSTALGFFILLFVVLSILFSGIYETQVDVRMKDIIITETAMDTDGTMIYFSRRLSTPVMGVLYRYDGWSALNTNGIPVIAIQTSEKTSTNTRIMYWHEQCHIKRMLDGSSAFYPKTKGVIAAGIEEVSCFVFGYINGLFRGIPYAT